jgi:hypothetical protein
MPKGRLGSEDPARVPGKLLDPADDLPLGLSPFLRVHLPALSQEQLIKLGIFNDGPVLGRGGVMAELLSLKIAVS